MHTAMKSLRILPGLLVGAAFAASCERPEPTSPPAPSAAGTWRAVLASPGGELPFALEIADAGGLSARAVTGAEEVSMSSVEQDGSELVFRFDWYDSEITARVDAGGDQMTGTWRRTGAGGADSKLTFTAERGETDRFLPLAEAGLEPVPGAPDSIGGHWDVVFTDEDGDSPARGELSQTGTRVEGTFLTPTGDYRYLEGTYEQGVLRLSTFDGAHAFLFVARARPDGTLAGDFWSRDAYHATWTARAISEQETVLPDAWTQVGLTNDEGRLAFEFPDLEGRPVSLDDPRFAGKVVLVNLFGSWCPNCHDEAPLLARWHAAYRDRGLEIVGLAYEHTGDVERDRRQVRRFAERYAIEYPLLLAGTSDKKAAGATLPDLTAVLSYPTSIFVGRDGEVRKIHSGFAGPGTGRHYERLAAEMTSLIEELLEES